jgi:hypothetical protein
MFENANTWQTYVDKDPKYRSPPYPPSGTKFAGLYVGGGGGGLNKFTLLVSTKYQKLWGG